MKLFVFQLRFQFCIQGGYVENSLVVRNLSKRKEEIRRLQLVFVKVVFI